MWLHENDALTGVTVVMMDWQVRVPMHKPGHPELVTGTSLQIVAQVVKIAVPQKAASSPTPFVLTYDAWKARRVQADGSITVKQVCMDAWWSSHNCLFLTSMLVADLHACGMQTRPSSYRLNLSAHNLRNTEMFGRPSPYLKLYRSSRIMVSLPSPLLSSCAAEGCSRGRALLSCRVGSSCWCGNQKR